MIGQGIRRLSDRFTPFLRALAHLAVGSDGQVLTLSSGKPVWGDAVESPIKAWVSFNGTGTVTILGSSNVSSITDNGTGHYTVNFATAMPDANYAWVASTKTSNTSLAIGLVCQLSGDTKTASSLPIRTSGSSSGTTFDYPEVNVAVLG